MVEIQPLRIEIGREEDGRFLASVPDLPGMMAYGDTPESALRKAKAPSAVCAAWRWAAATDVSGQRQYWTSAEVLNLPLIPACVEPTLVWRLPSRDPQPATPHLHINTIPSTSHE